jgi:hypothetical protein
MPFVLPGRPGGSRFSCQRESFRAPSVTAPTTVPAEVFFYNPECAEREFGAD